MENFDKGTLRSHVKGNRQTTTTRVTAASIISTRTYVARITGTSGLPRQGAYGDLNHKTQLQPKSWSARPTPPVHTLTPQLQGSIFSAIGRGIEAIVAAIAAVIMAIVSAITMVIVTIFDVLLDILCCRCCSRRSSSMGRRSRFRGGRAARY
ncbi:hypothetical protein C8F04DRAFT_1187648 [Mycena alexandri]|uniref:Uncharacterized protein n=1 Tax=Mycena alexandri TaxID=1745969 RepID=A0AAD6SK12_9AGAR|nr:hypothetical protein C8F04DRAFT_1187648 [Mycena alexandri]